MREGADLDLGRVTVLVGERGGRYPEGNSLLVRGDQTVVIDPALGLWSRGAELDGVDWALLSHCHEDHIAALPRFRGRAVRVHALDRIGLDSLDGLMQIYGYPEPIATPWRAALVERFHYEPRPDAQPFEGGECFDLGGGVRIHAIHTPGHTRGHCAFHIEPDDVLYLGDIDLSSFGPYYGDAWSDLVEFERTLERVEKLEARWYATFHHVGVIEGRDAFVERLRRFRAVIADRERRLLEFLAEPRTLEQVIRHRFVYRPGDAVAFADGVERRSMEQHLARLVHEGRAAALDAERFVARR